MTTSIRDAIETIERRLWERKVSKSRFFRLAGIVPCQWYRWKSGENEPTQRSWIKANRAMKQIAKNHTIKRIARRDHQHGDEHDRTQ